MYKLLFALLLLSLGTTAVAANSVASPADATGAAANVVITKAPTDPNAETADTGPKVYKWVDQRGVTHYSDQPQNQGDAPINLPALQVMDSTQLTSPPPPSNESVAEQPVAGTHAGEAENIPPNGDGTIYSTDQPTH